MSINLRDTLLAALATLPGTREFHIHVLLSSPRKHAALFPFALPRPRVYMQDILILLSQQAAAGSPRILVTAIEASVYNIPATSCAILYICKVDSTGQAIHPSPTATLVRALIKVYADPSTRPVDARHLWIHLFARAQRQYLFPNSADFSGKQPLSDIKLCGWWKRVLTEVAEEVLVETEDKAKLRLFYVLPGFSEVEATNALKATSLSSIASASTAAAKTGTTRPICSWSYGHPYAQTDIPLPCPRPTDSNPVGYDNLGHYIPWFDDDPKSRFIDEIAYTTEGEGVKSPARKRSRTGSHNNGDDETVRRRGQRGASGDEEGKEVQNGKEDRPLGELSKVSAEEFWERMSFRQECVAGAVTGFFVVGVSGGKGKSSQEEEGRSAVSPLAPQAGQVSSQINKRIMTSLQTGVEFSTIERAIRATEALEGAIKGLCEGIKSVSQVVVSNCEKDGDENIAFSIHRDGSDRRTPDRDISQPNEFLAPPRTPPPKMRHGQRIVVDVSPNPFPEPEASLETYKSHIYGSIWVNNAGIGERREMSTREDGGKVTVLAVRKKKKRND